MTMENWKFLINRLIALLTLIGSFMGATFGYNKFIIQNIGLDIFIVIIALELLSLIIMFFILLIAIIDYIRDNKNKRKD